MASRSGRGYNVHQPQVSAAVFRSSFSKTSEELRLTQPTVSEHVRDLEEELGVSLFDRSGRSIHATPEAEILFARASEIPGGSAAPSSSSSTPRVTKSQTPYAIPRI